MAVRRTDALKVPDALAVAVTTAAPPEIRSVAFAAVDPEIVTASPFAVSFYTLTLPTIPPLENSVVLVPLKQTQL